MTTWVHPSKRGGLGRQPQERTVTVTDIPEPSPSFPAEVVPKPVPVVPVKDVPVKNVPVTPIRRGKGKFPKSPVVEKKKGK